MAENENNAVAKEGTCGCKHKCSFMHRVFGLKGLSRIYKILSALVVLYLVYLVIAVWYYVITQGAPIKDSLLLTLQLILTYGFYALVLLTVARILKVLKKIKHAVDHK
ncbi:MAG: hypothetical protein LBM71_02760 [Elusimicrobiota bacterium]|jgi:hypothetical protein|nr:hypothetical protein [Elusimicrobiota bacterium]